MDGIQNKISPKQNTKTTKSIRVTKLSWICEKIRCENIEQRAANTDFMFGDKKSGNKFGKDRQKLTAKLRRIKTIYFPSDFGSLT
jgi:hypothetical protein